MDHQAIIDLGKRVIETELNEAKALLTRLDERFSESCQAVLNCQGKVIISGIGKSGHIGKKIAASLASTGSPAFFVHPAEALHGDLGMISEGDLVVLISYSGEASEFKTMVPLIAQKGIQIIAMTGNPQSYLAEHCDFLLNVGVTQEACPLGLAPTTSTVNTLIIGDALAITTMQMRHFDQHDFARSHPGGSLGARLLTRLDQLIEHQHSSARCTPETTLSEAIGLLCETGLGLLAVVSEQRVVGVFTDGDLRRALANNRA